MSTSPRRRGTGIGQITLVLLLLLATITCAPTEELYDFDSDGSFDEDDCGPEDSSIFPGALDPFGDGVDQNCDGLDGVDADGDGYVTNGPGVPDEMLTDCNDFDDSVYPGAPELPDAIDHDCDGETQPTGDDDDTGADDDDDVGPDDDDDSHNDDADGDGTPAGLDCDDNDPNLNAEDVDQDGMSTCDGDCDDKDPAEGAATQSEESNCSDGIDEDCDYRTDCEDDECQGVPPCDGTSGETDCGDGLDNDGDGSTDCADDDCTGSPECTGAEDCANGVDDDADGDIDCADPDCDTDPTCMGGVESDCGNGTDDDGDGMIDCDDSDCPVGVDTDGDGFGNCNGDCDDTDANINPGAPDLCNTVDDDCDPATPDGNSEAWIGTTCGTNEGECQEGVLECAAGVQLCVGEQTPTAEMCESGFDEDCDTFTDCQDPDCSGNPACGSSEVACSDGQDNDVDGLIDCDDPDCNNVDSDGDTYYLCTNDCNDFDANVHPGAMDLCNGVDDDCDPTTDENITDPSIGNVCGVGTPPCAYGSTACTGGNLNCVGGTGPGTEICDTGTDEDCDALSDCDDSDCALDLACAVSYSYLDLMVSELLADPAAVADAVGEWFEIRNTTADYIPLANWTLVVGADDYSIGASPNGVPANGQVVIANNNGALNGGVSVLIEWATMMLPNSGGTIQLLDPTGFVVHSLDYGGTNPPVVSAGLSTQFSSSAGITTPNVDDPANWCLSMSPWTGTAGDLGSPGEANEACSP